MKRLSHIREHLIPLLLLLLISVIAHHVWIFSSAPLSHGDWVIDYPERLKEYIALPSIWSTVFGIGGINYGILFWPFQIMAGLLSSVGLSTQTVLKILFLWPAALLTPVFSYILAYYVLRAKLASFTSAIVYSFSTLTIILKGAFLTLHVAVTFFPLFLLFFINFLKRKKVSSYIVCLSVLIIISIYEFRIFYIALWIATLYTLYHIIVYDKMNPKKILTTLFTAISVLLPSVLFNLYGIFSLAKSAALTTATVLETSLFGSWYVQLIKAVTLFQFDWTGGKIDPWVQQPIPIWFFLIPFCAFLGYGLYKNKSLLTFFALLAFIGVFFAKLNKAPFPDLYKWFFDYVPGFNAFREAGKFNFIAVLGYSILIGALISFLQKQKKRHWTILLSIFISFLFIWNAKPLVTGEFGTLFVPRTIPSDYLKLHEFINSQKGYFRTFMIPKASRWGTWSVMHPMIDNYQANISFVKPLRKKGESVYGVYINHELLDALSVKYVIIPLEDTQNDDNFFRIIGNRQGYIDDLDRKLYLKKRDIGLKEVVVYENPEFKPRIYATQKIENIHEKIHYKEVRYVQVSETEFRVNFQHVRAPFYLQFSDQYHPQWNIRVGSFSWDEVLLQKISSLPSTIHTQNTALTNSFFIDPVEICRHYSCKTNTDGSYDIKLTIYFKPQVYVYAGLYLSGAIIALLLALTMIYIVRKLR